MPDLLLDDKTGLGGIGNFTDESEFLEPLFVRGLLNVVENLKY